MSPARRFVAAAAGGAVLCLVVLLSRVPWQPSTGTKAELRVSLRRPVVATEQCRPPTEDEVRGIPPHMRPLEVCSGDVVPFTLRVVLDGDTLARHPVRPSGGRRGRTLSVFETYSLRPGAHEVEVAFWPDSSAVELPTGLALALRASLSLSGGEVALVTQGEDGGLVVR